MLIVSTRYYASDTYVDQSGERRKQPPFSKWEVNPYLEYALTDTLTVGVNAFAQYLRQDSANPFAGASLLNQGDVAALEAEIFTRHAVWRSGPYALALQPLLKLPSWYTRTDLAQHEHGSFAAQLGVIGGYGFHVWEKNGFAELGAAYRMRFGDPADQWRIDATLGVQLTPRILAMTALNAILAADAPSSPGFTALGEDDMDVVKWQVSAMYQLTDSIGVEAGGFRHIYARNTGEGGGAFLALWLRF